MNNYLSCEELPVRAFFRIFETGDLRHLLIDDMRLSKKNIDTLTKSWEGIISEYEELTKDSAYSSHMAISNDRMRKINRILGIKGALMLFSLNAEKGREALSFWKIKAGEPTEAEILRIRNTILSEQTRISITIEKDPKDEKVNFFEYWANFQTAVGYQMSYDKISVAEWIGILKTIRKRGRKN